MEYRFKKGVYKFNDQSNFDFQSNRVVMWDGGDIEEIKAVGSKITTSEDWKRELIALGDMAVSEGRTENAIAYYRMSEFFMYDGDPDKEDACNHCNCGNVKLTFDTFMNWILQIKPCIYQ